MRSARLTNNIEMRSITFISIIALASACTPVDDRVLYRDPPPHCVNEFDDTCPTNYDLDYDPGL